MTREDYGKISEIDSKKKETAQDVKDRRGIRKGGGSDESKICIDNQQISILFWCKKWARETVIFKCIFAFNASF